MNTHPIKPASARGPRPGRRCRLVALVPSLAFLSALAQLSLGSGCQNPTPDSPADAARGFYEIAIESGVSGAPTTDQLTALAPYLSGELRSLLAEARAVSVAEAVARPDEKPPYVEGDLFTSLFEGPTRFEIVGDTPGGTAGRVAVRFSYDRTSPPVVWTDTVVVADEDGRPVVADVIYGGTWQVANRGSLAASLHRELDRARSSGWILSLDGIGPVRVGMQIDDVERLLDDVARLDRIEPEDVCGYARFATVPAGVSFMVSGTTVVRVDVTAARIFDGFGLGLGSTEEAVVARHRDRVRVEPHPYMGPEGHTLVVEDPAQPGFRQIFETDGRLVIGMRAGRLPEVDYIEGCS